MSQALFISPNEEFTSRIRKESNAEALVASSLNQGLLLITDPQAQLKAIYLNPNDSSYSALQFLELSLLHRPATPIFLIDPEGELNPEAQKIFFERHHIQGVFGENERYVDYLAKTKIPLTTRTGSLQPRGQGCNQLQGYIAVPILDFLHTSTYLFDVFVEGDNGRLNLFATSGSPVEPDYIAIAIEQSSWFYVSEESIKEIRENIRKTQFELSASSSFPVSWKTAETLYKAKTLLEDLHSSGVSDALVDNTHELLGEVFQLVSQLQTMMDSNKLSKFIEDAKNCDRSIACASLSILMCKSLRFEKNAIIEILGIASLLQDVSLFASPFGKLDDTSAAEMSPEAKAYYLKHPLHSADLLAQNTSIPDVTLQVIRQHHERKDRTGFPGRVGGLQLHPMAEVLSLINEFIDQNPQTVEDENKIFGHFSDRIVAAYKQIRLVPKASAQTKLAA